MDWRWQIFVGSLESIFTLLWAYGLCVCAQFGDEWGFNSRGQSWIRSYGSVALLSLIVGAVFYWASDDQPARAASHATFCVLIAMGLGVHMRRQTFKRDRAVERENAKFYAARERLRDEANAAKEQQNEVVSDARGES